MTDPVDASRDGEIEVGETGDTLRFWLAKEAIRHGETHLTAQAASLSAMEARATSILGWAVTGVFALGALATTGQYRAAAGFAAAVLSIAAVFCIVGLWPRGWAVAGLHPAQIRNSGKDTELGVLEYVALCYEAAIDLNVSRLKGFGRYLACSWVCFVASPAVAALIAYFAAIKA